MGERLLRLGEVASRLAHGDRPLSRKTVNEIAKRENWTRVVVSPGVVAIPESEVAATIERKIREAKAGAVAVQREISRLGVEARRRKREAAA